MFAGLTAGRSPQKRGFSVFGGTQCHERGRAYGGWNDPSKMITQRAPTPNCNFQLTCKPSHTPSWQKLFNRELVWHSLICVDRTGTTTQKMICMDLHVCHACALTVRSYLQLTLTPAVVQAQYLPPLNDITTSTEATVARAQLRNHMLQCRRAYSRNHARLSCSINPYEVFPAFYEVWTAVSFL